MGCGETLPGGEGALYLDLGGGDMCAHVKIGPAEHLRYAHCMDVS